MRGEGGGVADVGDGKSGGATSATTMVLVEPLTPEPKAEGGGSGQRGHEGERVTVVNLHLMCGRDVRHRQQRRERRAAIGLYNRWGRMLQRRVPNFFIVDDDGSLLLRRRDDRIGHHKVVVMQGHTTQPCAEHQNGGGAEPPAPGRCSHRPRALVQPDRRDARPAHRAVAALAQVAAWVGSTAPRRSDGGNEERGSRDAFLHRGIFFLTSGLWIFLFRRSPESIDSLNGERAILDEICYLYKGKRHH
uniref:Uncharacterized protein n=1 Tax=Triticum urartu TaxID=4572 RepID=A0A8R7UEK6_TRIUA